MGLCVCSCLCVCVCVFLCAHTSTRGWESHVSLCSLWATVNNHGPMCPGRSERPTGERWALSRSRERRTELRFSTKKSNEYFIHRNGSCLSYFLLSVIATQPQKNVIVKCLLLINHKPCLDLALWSDDSSRQHVIHCALNWFIDEQPNVLFTSIPCFIKSLFSSAAYNSPLQRHIINQ